jgi:NitT/TauT family transport system ATP-binding protein
MYLDPNTLPSYREQSPAVRARFERIAARDVILEVRNLGKVFDTAGGRTQALHDINFKVHRREFVCVIGPSGCGKSTLIRILAGLESHSSGEVLLDGKPVTGPGRDRGMVFQGYSLFPWLTVKRNVMFGPEMSGSSRTTAEAPPAPATGAHHADGRAVRRAGRADPLEDAVASAGHLAEHRHHDALHHP